MVSKDDLQISQPRGNDKFSREPLIRSNRTIHFLFALLVAYAVGRDLIGAGAKPLWFDEIQTLAIADRPTLKMLWSTLERGFDVQPPSYYLVERAALKLTGKREIALRLPSIFAFSVTLACVFFFASKKCGDLIGLLAALSLMATSLFHTYSIEARPYSLEVGFIAFALVCYQRLPSRYWGAALGVSLLLATSFHYYGVFAVVPFGIAEAVFLFRMRVFRWFVWLALTAGLFPLVAFRSLLHAAKAYYGEHVFAQADFAALTESYRSYFFLGDSSQAVALVMLCVVPTVIALTVSTQKSRDDAHANDSDWPETILCLGLVALPPIVLSLIAPMHGTFWSRYTLAATIGIVLSLAKLFSHASRRSVTFLAIIVICLVGARELRFWRYSGRDPLVRISSPKEVSEFVQSTNLGVNLPVVIGDGVLFGRLSYYSPSPWRERWYWLADAKRELRYEGTDSMVKNMLGLRELLPLPSQVVDYSQFTATHPEFLLYSEDSDGANGARWVIDSLVRDGHSVKLFDADSIRQLYLVQYAH